MKRRRLIIVGAGLALLLGGGSLAGTALTSGALASPFLARGAEKDAPVAERTPEPRRGVTLSTKERVVSLADTPVFRYLKTEVVLEFPSGANGKQAKSEDYKKVQEELQKELAPMLPAIEDIITVTLASRTALEAASPAGKERLKTELLERLRGLPLEPAVNNVYFTQFIIQ